MIFQEPTPDTSGYMIAGYVIAFLVMGLYVLSLYLRTRNLHQDMTVLEEMDNQFKARSEAQPKKGLAKSSGRKTSKAVTKRPQKK